MGRRYRTKSNATTGEAVAIMFGFMVFFVVWIILGAILFPVFNLFSFVISFVPMLFLFKFAFNVGNGLQKVLNNAPPGSRKSACFPEIIKSKKEPQNEQEAKLFRLYEAAEDEILKCKRNDDSLVNLEEAEKTLLEIMHKIGFHPYTSNDIKVGRKIMDKAASHPRPLIRIGPRGGRYEERFTKDGRLYRRYF